MAELRVGVIGLGAMGSRMAQRLADQGLLARAYDIEKARMDSFGELAASSVREVAEEVPVVLASLPGAAEVEDALAPALRNLPGAARTVIDTTTRSPQEAKRLAGVIELAGHEYLDAPVSGGVAAARAGTLRLFIGGTAAAVEHARPVIDALSGGSHRHVGPVGAGSACKLMNNLLYAANLVMVGEAMRAAGASGVPAEVFIEALNGATGRSLVSEHVFPDFILTGSFDTQFAIGLMRRDVQLAISSLPDGTHLPVLERLAETWTRSSGWLEDHEDTARMVTALPEIAAALTEEMAV